MKVKNMNGDIWLINEQTNNTEINESISCSHVIFEKDNTLLHLAIYANMHIWHCHVLWNNIPFSLFFIISLTLDKNTRKGLNK